MKEMNSKIDIKLIVFEKIRAQWKTISRAYKDLSSKEPKIDGITKNELKFYLDHWGLNMSEE